MIQSEISFEVAPVSDGVVGGSNAPAFAPITRRRNKRPAKDLILEYLSKSPNPLAIHEMHIYGVSQNSIGSRLPELALDKKVDSQYREGESFKEWWII